MKKKIILITLLSIVSILSFSQSRWYSFHNHQTDQFLLNKTVDYNLILLWKNKDILFNGNWAFDTLSTPSMGFVLDPSSTTFNSSSYYYNKLEITDTNSYVLDSLIIYGRYYRNPQSQSIDTLRLSLVSGDTSSTSNLPSVIYNWNNYNDTIFSNFLFYDSANKVAAKNPASNVPVTFYDILLDSTMAFDFLTNGPSEIKVGGINYHIPQGNLAVTMTYISGENYIPFDTLFPNINGDPKYNVFSALLFEENMDGFPSIERDDYNRGFVQNNPPFLGTDSIYLPSIAWTDPLFKNETPIIDFKLSCPSCDSTNPTISYYGFSDRDTAIACFPNSTPIYLYSLANYVQWMLNGVDIAGANNYSYTPTADGLYQARVAYNGDTTYSKTLQLYLINPPTVQITPSTTISLCPNDSILLECNYDSNFQYNWEYNFNNVASITDTSLYASMPGTYSVQLTKGYCFNSYNINVQQQALPNATIATPSNLSLNLCEGDSSQIILNGSNQNSISWFRDNLLLPADTNNILDVNGSGQYFAILNNGCILSTDTVTVIVNPLPVISIANSNNTLQASSTNYVTYEWYNNGVLITGANQPSYSVSQNGNYSLLIVDSNGCANSSNIIIINSVNLKNVFANNDNDIKIIPNPSNGNFKIETKHVFKYGHFSLMDYTGRAIISRNVINNNTCIFNKVDLPIGLYFVKAIIDDKTAILKIKIIK